MGVWIEIAFIEHIICKYYVTPCVGVWIEIASQSRSLGQHSSLPAWECGLKFLVFEGVDTGVRSLPAWECGLKSDIKACAGTKKLSLPAWECGLKFGIKTDCASAVKVTPCVGVWIEIMLN